MGDQDGARFRGGARFGGGAGTGADEQDSSGPGMDYGAAPASLDPHSAVDPYANHTASTPLPAAAAPDPVRPVNPYTALPDEPARPATTSTSGRKAARKREKAEKAARRKHEQRRRQAVREQEARERAARAREQHTPREQKAPDAGTAPRRTRRTQDRARTSPAPTTGRAVRRVIGVAVGLAIVAVFVLVLVRWTGGGGGGSGAVDDPPETVWSITAADLHPALGSYTAFVPLHDRDPYSDFTPYLTTEDAWVVRIEAAEDSKGTPVPSQVAAFDPADGSPLWRFPLPDGVCAEGLTPSGDLVCFSDDGTASAGHVLDLATGEELASWPIEGGVWSAQMTGSGVAVLAETGPDVYSRLMLLDPADGSASWSRNLLDIAGGIGMFNLEQDYDTGALSTLPDVAWAPVEPNLVLWSPRITAFVDLGSGDVTLHECWNAGAVGDGTFGCTSGDGTTVYDASGTPLWTDESMELAEGVHGPAPTLLNVTDDVLRATDWTHGTVGEDLHEAHGRPMGTGTAEHPFLVDDSHVVALTPGADEVLWEAAPDDLDLYPDVLVVGEHAVVTGYDQLAAYDLTSGEHQWTIEAAGDAYASPAGVVLVRYNEISLLASP